MADSDRKTVFDYKLLRFFIGVIALVLPFLVTWIAGQRLTSVSASYHTDAQDVFVGLLFFVAAFLLAYNGHLLSESVASKVAGMAAILVALFPTAPDGAPTDFEARVHGGAALTLFLILAYFCFFVFRKKIKRDRGPRRRRSRIYFACGSAIVVSILVVIAAVVFLPDDVADEARIIYWAESVALVAFGIAWLVSGKVLPGLVDKERDDVLQFRRGQMRSSNSSRAHRMP
jgi:hypothetical protein